MPYIPKRQRNKLEPIIRPLMEKAADLTKGEINYIITRLIARKYHLSGYAEISEGASVLQDVRDEWVRRVIAPYEDKKCKENGDVF